MKQTELKKLFVALAFVTVLIKEKDCDGTENTWRIRQLASLIESFCDGYGDDTVLAASLYDGRDAEEIDLQIKRHIEELRNREQTRLPADKQTLVRFHDRLQQRKTRRMQREFYASVTEEQLADNVLSLLDEEIDLKEALG